MAWAKHVARRKRQIRTICSWRTS